MMILENRNYTPGPMIAPASLLQPVARSSSRRRTPLLRRMTIEIVALPAAGFQSPPARGLGARLCTIASPSPVDIV